MKLRQQKRILFFLKILESNIEKIDVSEPFMELLQLFTDDELVDIINWSYPEKYTLEELKKIERHKLIKSISSNKVVLQWTIHQMENAMTSTPKYTETEIKEFFNRTHNGLHYLNVKPIGDWDGYDRSNYRSLLLKTGSTKKVYAILTSDVLAEDVFAVTSKPSYFFDTKEEAETEIKNIVAKGDFTADDLVVHSFWLLTTN